MSDCTKNIWDVALHTITILGAIVAFWVGIYQWRKSQRWQRAAQLDKLVNQFETDKLLQLAATVVDWTKRKIRFDTRDLIVTNEDALLALRDHEEAEWKFEGNQPLLRDAYDAWLTFFGRLELAIASGLIDAKPAQQYFGYWLKHFLAFDKHDTTGVAGVEDKSPPQMVIHYIETYGDLEAIERLRQKFSIESNAE